MRTGARRRWQSRRRRYPRVEDAPAMRCDEPIDNRSARLQPGERADLVARYQPPAVGGSGPHLFEHSRDHYVPPRGYRRPSSRRSALSCRNDGRGHEDSQRRRGRAPAMGSGSRTLPRRSATGAMRRKRPSVGRRMRQGLSPADLRMRDGCAPNTTVPPTAGVLELRHCRRLHSPRLGTTVILYRDRGRASHRVGR